jgi:predicted RNA-binding protein (virulence factor B family)
MFFCSFVPNMIEIGKFNLLKVNRRTLQGFYLVGPDNKEVLLPNKYIPSNLQEGELIDVFVYTDSEDRIIATNLEPYVIVGEFAYMDVMDVSEHGAFLDWGLEKDLFVPMREQRSKMLKGKSYIIYAYLDEQSNRVVATTKYNRYIKTSDYSFAVGDEVELLISDQTEMGFNAIINDEAIGLLFNNEIHQPVKVGDRTKAFVKHIREDGKIDLIFQTKKGVELLDEGCQRVLAVLTKEGGELNMGDFSSPEEINHVFGLSKKVFKKSIGILFKNKKIELLEKGIKLI